MRSTDILVRSIIFALGVVATCAFAVTKIPPALAWATSRKSAEYGDLYRLAKIEDFKPALPLPGGSFAYRDSIDAGRMQPDPDDIIYLGDSFSFCDWGGGPLYLQIQRKLGLPVFSIYNNNHPSPWVSPYQFVNAQAVRMQSRRIVVYEIVERLIQDEFNKPAQMSGVLPPIKSASSTLSQIRNDMLTDTELKHQLLLECSKLTFPIVSEWNTLVFHSLRTISPETPLFSLNPPFLFFKGEVQCFEAPHSDGLIARLAGNIALLSNDLKGRLNCTLVFLPVPNKITVYSHLVKEKPYDDFLPRLCAALRKRGVNTVELLPAFRQQSQFLYWPAETHWNNAGIQIAAEKTVENWPRQ